MLTLAADSGRILNVTQPKKSRRRAKSPAPRGGARKGAGRKSAYPRKDIGRTFPMAFTEAGQARLLAMTKSTGLSRNDVLTYLVIKYVGQLRFDSDGIAFANKAAAPYSIRMPARAGKQLVAARKRTKRSYSDIGEALVTWYGPVAKCDALNDAISRLRSSRGADQAVLRPGPAA